MTQVPSTVLQALSEILAAQSPQFAARLKQRLTATLEAKGEHPFDERKFGFKGFRDFLLNGTQGLFSVTPSEDGADVIVSLGAANSPSTISSAPTAAASHSIRSEVWQAFTNPDVSRVRYFGLRTFTVRHFLRGEDSLHAKEVAESPTDFVEIEPISADVQVAWMKQFIEERQISSPLRDALDSIVAKPYSSGINAAFTGALGSLGTEWRQVRIKKVIDSILAWAHANGVPPEKLSPRQTSEGDATAAATTPRSVPKSPRADAHDPHGIQDPREQAVRLLDMLSSDDISRVVVPILLSTLLVRGKG